ncbi:MAG: HD domain-containing protein [candidate division Zixibacteria bacterium]|nr:HD domain-containing protein [candidate division Zixibacteria bacterium]
MKNTKSNINDRLKLVLEVGRALNSEIEIDSLLELIATKTTMFLNAERCSIYVVDIDKNMLWTKTAIGEEKIEISIDTGIAGAVVKSGEIINVADAYEDERFNRQIDKITGYITKSMLSGPMHNISGETIGVFQVLNSKSGVFTDEDEELLKALSGFAGNALENALLYEELKETFHSVLEVMAATIDAKHPYTAGHTARVAQYSCGIANEMGLDASDVEIIRVAAYLHDYGKIGIRDSVLSKPGKLDDKEYSEMKSHARKTTEILSKMRLSRQYRDIPLIAGSHHERYDGKGYPSMMSNGEIPLGARILSVADVFDAITSDRDYRKATPYKEALEMMREEIGKAFDPEVFKAFESYFNRELLGN